MEKITIENIAKLTGQEIRNNTPIAISTVYKILSFFAVLIFVNLLHRFVYPGFYWSTYVVICTFFMAIFLQEQKEAYEFIGKKSKKLQIDFIQQRIDDLENNLLPALFKQSGLSHNIALVNLIQRPTGVGSRLAFMIETNSINLSMYQLKYELGLRVKIEEQNFCKKWDSITQEIEELNKIKKILETKKNLANEDN